MSTNLAEEVSIIFERAKQEALTLIQKQSEVPIPEVAPLLTARDVAARLQTNRQAVYRLAREGKLPPVPLSTRTRRWTEDVVNAFINGHPETISAGWQSSDKTLQAIDAKR